MAKKGSIEEKVLAFLQEAGATIDGIERKNHVKVKWTLMGEARMVVFPQSASDFRAEKNAISFLRREVRSIRNDV